MIYLDLALRGGAITLLLLLSALLWRAPINLEGRLSVGAVAISKSAFLILTTALPLGLHPALTANLIFLSSFTPAAVTWLIVTIFLDAPGRRGPWIAGGVIASIALYINLTVPAFPPICLAVNTILYAALLGLSLWSTCDDLVECRARARPGFAAAIAGMALFLTLGQATGLLQQGTLTLAIFQSSGVFAVALAFAVWMLRPDATRWPGAPAPETDPHQHCDPDFTDPALVQRINAAMSVDIWREEGLTIGALATRLAVPEHRLRRAINQGLGHRNFSSFINRARIEAACADLENPALLSKTILEIAYDVGFASVGPFNRAFRAEVGQSPTEYRRRAQTDGFADSENSAPKTANLH